MKDHFTAFLIIIFLLIVPLFSLLKIYQFTSDNQKIEFFPENNISVSPQPSPSPLPSPTISPQPISIIFTGDAMFDRHIRTNARKNGYDAILNNLTSLFNQSDLVVTNLEGPITTNQSRSENSIPGSTDNYFFTFDPQVAAVLKKNNIDLVNLGNNHILNFGENGLQQTLDFLDKDEIRYFGNTGTDLTKDYIIWQTNDMSANNLNIAFINHNQFVSDGATSSLKTLKQLFAEKNQRSIDLIIIYAHWGNEYETIANSTIQAIAHTFIDNGADLVVGSHPHVVQQSEVYGGKTIYYSLGNFVFDQFFEANVQNGLMVKAVIDPTTLEMKFEEIPIIMTKEGRTLIK